MGNCFGKSATQKREGAWQRTGIVSLRDKGLRTLPSGVTAIAGSIKVLDASNNHISDLLEQELCQFAQLQRLVLTGNQLRRLPSSVSSLQQLKLLALDSNRLTGLPEEIGQLGRLEQLLLQNNSLVSLPASLGSLSMLKVLNVSNNKLTQLPSGLGNCSSIQELSASNNRLSDIPATLGALGQLKVLQLDDNNIAAVPSEVLQGCSGLHTLSLHNNPITPAVLEATEGYQGYDARRRAKYDKAIGGGALLSSNGLDEGIDRLLKPQPN